MSTGGGLSASSVSKSFYGNRVLREFDLQIPKGKLHALLGHNGSGKSTFIKILAGYYTPDSDSGQISVDGHELIPGDPDSSRDAGISFVHQTLGLVPTLSVLENLRLGKPWQTNSMGKISWSKERRLARESLAEFGLKTSPDAIVGRLSTVEQTEVAIVRALSESENIRVLVLDEPTASLTDHEVRKLFSTIERVKARGVSILYVSHRLEEIQLIADDVTILRDGVTVGRGPVAEFPGEVLVRLVAGAPDPAAAGAEAGAGGGAAAGTAAANGSAALDQRAEADWDPEEDVFASGVAPVTGEPLLTITSLRGGELRDANFEARPGEIVGVVGLLGSGVIDLARVLTGRLEAGGGKVVIDGQVADLDDFAALSRRGVGAVVGNREDRVAMSLTVRENLTLGVIRSFFRGGRLNHRAEAASAREAIGRYEVRCAGPEVEMASLSGGNQQKAAIAKVLQMSPKLLVLEEPCHGVDARGREEIAAMLKQAAADGALVLVMDSDLEEVVGLCSRVVVLREGVVAGEFHEGDISRSGLLDACYGSIE